MTHVDYPHEPGRLYDCPGCEDSDCVCESGDSPCVSIVCENYEYPTDFDDEPDGGWQEYTDSMMESDLYETDLYEEYGHA